MHTTEYLVTASNAVGDYVGIVLNLDKKTIKFYKTGIPTPGIANVTVEGAEVSFSQVGITFATPFMSGCAANKNVG